MTRMALTVLALFLAACATPVQQVPVQAPAPTPAPTPAPAEQQAPAPAALDPVGVYDFTTDVEGTRMAGVLMIRRTEEGRLTGSISTDMTGEMPLQSVTMEGRRALLRASIPDGELYIQVDFLEDNRIAGGWELSTGPSGAMTGQRRRTGG
jgi:hypothetical protein